MPSIDGGHIYLTLLLPVRIGGVAGPDGVFVTHSHALREELALLPTAQQSPETVAAGLVSPFAHCRRTHFLRLVVIDQPMWNGRDPIDPVWNVIAKKNPKEQPVFDVLSRPWLLLAADIDRRPDLPDEGLAAWAEGLWSRSRDELDAIFSHTEGYAALTDAPQFAAWLKRHQIETTMSFNGYYDGDPVLKGTSLKLAALLLAGIALGVGLLVWALFGSAWHLIWALPLGLGLGAWATVRRLGAIGAKPFPAFPDSDLPTVLKALWLQQRFSRFAEQAQGLSAEALHAEFAAFLSAARPDDLSADWSQPPGVVRSDGGALPEPERNQVERVGL